MSLEIRFFANDDAERYWHFRLEALEQEPQSFGESVEEHRQTTPDSALERISGDPNNFVAGAFLDKQLVGMAGFFRYKLRNSKHKGRIWGVYVRKEHRGKGIGRAVLSTLLQRIRSIAGIEQVTLTVVKGQYAARALYRSFGFVSFGSEARALKVDGMYYDDEHMVLML